MKTDEPKFGDIWTEASTADGVHTSTWMYVSDDAVGNPEGVCLADTDPVDQTLVTEAAFSTFSRVGNWVETE